LLKKGYQCKNIILEKEVITKMVRFEIKKIISKPVSKIVFIILLAALCIVSYLAVSNVRYVDENGDTIKGISAARSLR